jgi:hypothetical protein
MTTTVPDGLWDLRESVRIAEAAATSARQNRSAAQESARLAGALADRRAVQGLHPTRLAYLLRGRGAAERVARTRALQTAVGERDEVVARVRAHLDDAERFTMDAEVSSGRAAALPRLLDELTEHVRLAGGDSAARPSETDPDLPRLSHEVELTQALQAVHEADRLVRDGLDRLVSAYAWGRYDDECGDRPGPALPPARMAEAREAVELVTGAVLTVRRAVTPARPRLVGATDAWLDWASGPDGVRRLEGTDVALQAPLEQTRLLAARLESVASALQTALFAVRSGLRR